MNSPMRKQWESLDFRSYPVTSSDSSRSHLTRSSTFDETDSQNSVSHESKFSRQSSIDGYNQHMSSRGSLSTFSLSGLSRSASQDGNFDIESRASSWSSLLNNSGNGDDSCPVNIHYSPLLEKLFEDAESLNLLPKQHFQVPDQIEIKNKSRRDLIIPDEESEEIPFAKYTFNKKPGSIGSGSPSEKSSSSKDSKDSFDKLYKRSKYMQSSSSCMSSSSLASSSHFDEDSMSFGQGYQMERKPVKQMSNQWVSVATNNDQVMYPSSLPQMFPQQSFSMPLQSSQMYFHPVPTQPSPPDQMLMNLGFADDMENFLPARFAQDWRQKIFQKQQEMYIKAQQQMYYQSRPHTDRTQQGSSFQTTYAENTSSDSSPEMTVSTRSSFSSVSKSDKKSKKTKRGIPIDDTLSASERQTSIEKLRNLLQSDCLLTSINKEKTGGDVIKKMEAEKAMDMKRKQFARARQKSLPIYLETLSEEDECTSLKNKLISSKMHVEESPSDESTKSASENSTSGHSVSSSISEANFTDCDISDYKIINMQEQKSSQNMETKPTKEGKLGGIRSVPSICVENGIVSNESLEIDEILGNPCIEKPELHVEPAMVSVVLNDADSKHKNVKHLSHLTPHFFGNDMDYKLSRRRSSSSLSISPMPSSPVTVIEVGLDNQNDSLDNVTDSIENDDTSHGGHMESSFSVFSATLEEKINHRTEDDSPLNNTESKQDGNSPNISVMDQKKFISQVNYLSKSNSLSIEIPSTEYQDMCIQADDGSLSPIIRFTDYEYLFQKLVTLDDENIYYLAKDRGTQYEVQPEGISLDLDKVQLFSDNWKMENGSNSLKHSAGTNSGSLMSNNGRHSVGTDDSTDKQTFFNTFHKNIEIQTYETAKCTNELGIQTDPDNNESKGRIVELKDNSTVTSSYITHCRCPINVGFPRSDSDSSSTSDIQSSLQATIDRLERKTRKYRALYGKKD